MSGGTSAAQLRNTELVDILSTDFVKRNESTLAWGKAISMLRMLPGARGAWPMSSISENGTISDLAGQSRNLSRPSGGTAGLSGLAPHYTFNGTTDYLMRADEAGLDITGTETTVDAPGLTLGGWFRFDALGAAEALISKWNGTTAQRSYVIQKLATDLAEIRVSLDGGSVNVSAVSSVTAIAAAAWTFIVGRFTPSAEVAVWNNNEKTTSVAAIIASIFSGTAEFDIGRLASPGSYLDGKASLCFLCAYALPDYIIQAFYEHTRPLFGQ